MVDLEGRLRLHDDISYRVHRIGAENEAVLVVDSLFAEPQVLIDYAIAHRMEFAKADSFYPGERVRAPEIYSFALRAFLGPLIAQVFGLEGRRVARERCEFSIVTTSPERLQEPQRLPHADSTDPEQLAFLHFLCDPEQAGTSFYRHRRTGYETITQDRLASYIQALKHEFQTHGAPPPRYIAGDTELFERIACFEAVPNRLIAYRGMLLHSADIAPGRILSDAPGAWRLTVNSFLHYE